MQPGLMVVISYIVRRYIMNVNGTAGVNQYTNQQNSGLAASQSVDDALQKQRPGDLTQTALNSSNSNTEKQAFKVDITDRAKELAASENTKGAAPEVNMHAAAVQAPAANETQSPANNNGEQQAQQLVNIVA